MTKHPAICVRAPELAEQWINGNRSLVLDEIAKHPIPVAIAAGIALELGPDGLHVNPPIIRDFLQYLKDNAS